MISVDKNYPLKVWGAAIFFAPIIMFIRILIQDVSAVSFSPDIFLLFCFLIFFSCLYSLPAFGLYYLAFKKLKNLTMPVISIKLTLAIFFVGLFLATFYIINKEIFAAKEVTNALTMPASYCVCILIASIYFKLYKKENIEEPHGIFPIA